MKRMISMVLALCMVLSLLPADVLAAERPLRAYNSEVTFTVTADRTQAAAGDVVSFTVYISEVANLHGVVFTLQIPDGLRFVSLSAQVSDRLKSELNFGEACFAESTMVFVGVTNDAVTLTEKTELLTFQCEVEDTAQGQQTVGLEIQSYDVFDIDYNDLPFAIENAVVEIVQHSTHTYVNGFCSYCDAYEPAVLNGDVYEISNAGQLYWFAAKVNGGSTSINGKLMADILVNENVLKADGTLNGDGSNFRVWTPIGYFEDNYDYVSYVGFFDGNGKVVSGLYFNDTSKDYGGFFGYVGDCGKVQNVGINDSYHCGNKYVGGVVGINYGTVSGCYNTGSVSGSSSSVGGVVGDNNGGTVNGCYNTGVVKGYEYVGGVVGYSGDSKGLAQVTHCYNTGSVSGGPDVGGVVGCNSGSVSGCYNTGSVSSSGYSVGGVVGSNYSGTVSNCYYLSGRVTNGNEYGNTMTASQFASGEVAYLLGKDYGQTIGTDTYPTLGGAKVYKNQIAGCNTASYVYEYSNTQAAAMTTHEWIVENCTEFCMYCGALGNAWGHDWADATCTEPMTCRVCGATEGDALGHSWKAATCTEPKTCMTCGETEGEANGHHWFEATCLYPKFCDCGATEGEPLGHAEPVYTDVPPTCTEDGYTIVVCPRCGETGTNNEVPALGHEWEDATCTTAKTCSRCGLAEGNPLGHRWVVATCTAPKTCSVCGATEGSALGHKWNDATCTEPKTCTVCGATEGSALGHSWIDATCTEPKICSVCKATSGNALGHNWADATCTEPKTCSVCKATEGNVLGHNWADATCTKPSTCTTCGATTGNALGHKWNDATCTEPKTCTTCGATTGNALGHNWADTTCTAPKTCTTCGVTSGNVLGHSWAAATCENPKICVNCQMTEGEALGHKWADATCTTAKICTVCKVTVGNSLGHSWNAPSCTAPGTCSVCGTTSGAALGHDWASATCMEPKTCKICGATEGSALGHSWTDATCTEPKTCSLCKVTVGNALGHDYTSVVTAPGCLTDGYTTHTCTACGDSYRDTYVFATGHSWTDATCTSPMTCSVCGATKGEPEPHSFGETVVHEPTSDALGYSEHTCKVCGFTEQFDFVQLWDITVSGSVESFLDGDVTIQLVQDGEVVYSTTVSGGSYTLEGVEAGTYTLRVSKANHAPVEFEVTVGTQDVTIDAKLCPKGDVTGDGVVNIKDFQRLLRHVNKTNPLTDYALACGDVTGDGVCNIKDFQRLLRHVNKTNPLF